MSRLVWWIRRRNGIETKKDNEWQTDEGKDKNRRARKRRGRSATLAMEGKSGVTKRIKGGRKVTIVMLSTMKSRWKLPKKSSMAKSDA